MSSSLTRAEQSDSTESEEEKDRKQDQSIALLADQTEWIEKQTKWIRCQAIASIILGALTLAVLVYHAIVMDRQFRVAEQAFSATRAQLFVQKMTMFKPENRENPLIVATYVNRGRLPATLLYASILYSVGTDPWGISRRDQPANIRTETWGEEEPGADAPSLPADESNKLEFTPKLTTEEVSRIYGQTTVLYLELKIAYQDGLGNPRDLRQCFSFLPYSGEFVGGTCPPGKEQSNP